MSKNSFGKWPLVRILHEELKNVWGINENDIRRAG